MGPDEVFINYRGKEDSLYAADLLYTDLSHALGSDRVFLDSESIKPGADFVRTLIDRVRGARVVLAVIGPRWLTVQSADGQRRIDAPDDWIRRELVEAYDAGVPVIPILTDDATMPTEIDLPHDIAQLGRTQYVLLRQRYAQADIALLLKKLAGMLPADTHMTAARRQRTARIAALVTVLIGAVVWMSLHTGSAPGSSTSTTAPRSGSRSAPRAEPAPANNPVVIYEVTQNNKLYWHDNPNPELGVGPMNHDQGVLVTPRSWTDYVKVTATQDGIIYAIDANGDLNWYRHLDPTGGSNKWADGGIGKKIAAGWMDTEFIAASGDGVLYRVTSNGDLYWYRHLDPIGGTNTWAYGGIGRKIAVGWRETKFMAAGGNGVLYRVMLNGDMYWYRHLDPTGGTDTWANNGIGTDIGVGWLESKSLTVTSDGLIYRVFSDGTMRWYHYLDPTGDTDMWANNGIGRLIGVSW